MEEESVGLRSGREGGVEREVVNRDQTQSKEVGELSRGLGPAFYRRLEVLELSSFHI